MLQYQIKATKITLLRKVPLLDMSLKLTNLRLLMHLWVQSCFMWIKQASKSKAFMTSYATSERWRHLFKVKFGEWCNFSDRMTTRMTPFIKYVVSLLIIFSCVGIHVHGQTIYNSTVAADKVLRCLSFVEVCYLMQKSEQTNKVKWLVYCRIWIGYWEHSCM